MQFAMGFAADDRIAWIWDRLQGHFGYPKPFSPRTPIGQLVKSMISSRTRDEVSLEAYRKLISAYPRWHDLSQAPVIDVECVIAEVTFADVKARYLHDALKAVASYQVDYDLDFLSSLSVPGGLAWLETLAGVGRKVSASTLNFSTLAMPAFVIDTHILRILRRYGIVGGKADTYIGYDTVMRELDDWSARDLQALHILMKHLGQTICRADHAYCRDCPISERCRTAARGQPHAG